MNNVPPEVIVDRYVRNTLVRTKGFESCVGKQNLQLLEPALGTLLLGIQTTFNSQLAALTSNSTHTRSGVTLFPFHVDYVEASVTNALAFRYEGYAFIVITVPLVRLMWHACEQLSKSAEVVRALGADGAISPVEAVHATLFASQLGFLLAHEYTHHIHGHHNIALEVWTEGLDNSLDGGLDSQAQEVDADAFAAYIVLTHLIAGERRQKTLDLLGKLDIDETADDGRLLASFVLAIGAFLYCLSPSRLDLTTVFRLTHPPPVLRMRHLMDAAKSWSSQNKPPLESVITLEWFQSLMRLVRCAMGISHGSQNWDEQTAFLSSDSGDKYCAQLAKQFDRLRSTR